MAERAILSETLGEIESSPELLKGGCGFTSTNKKTNDRSLGTQIDPRNLSSC